MNNENDEVKNKIVNLKKKRRVLIDCYCKFQKRGSWLLMSLGGKRF